MAETDEQITQTDAPPAIAAPAEPETPAPTTPAPTPAPRRGGWIGPLLGGILAAGAGFGLAQYVPDGWPLARTQALGAELADLKTQVEALSNQPAPDLSPVLDTLTALNGRVAALETVPANAAETGADLAAALAVVEQKLAALEKAGPAAAPDAQVPANIAALAAEAEARLKEAEAQAARMKAEAEALTKAATARAALGRLQLAVDQGQPFAAILPDLGAEVPAVLADHAATGLPSLPDLQASFPEAARQALEAALRADMGDSWTERATSFLRSQTGARSLTPQEGTDPDAILSRAEAALALGDLPGALGELHALSDVAKEALAGWTAQAETRVTADKALQALAAQMSE